MLGIGAILVLAEAHVSSLGVVGGPGVAALAAGAVLATIGLGGGVLIGVLAAVVLAATAVGALGVTIQQGAGVRRRRIRTGAEGMIGHGGVVRSWDERGGTVLVDGALWRARYSDFDDDTTGLTAGDSVVVEYMSGLTVFVRHAEEWELEP